jgi:ABC-type polar amino acid transport system ATPase subunit
MVMHTRISHEPGAGRPAGISCRGIYKAFSKTEVLRGIDLSVGAGETVAVIGASGSGKSTLCRVLIGLELLDTGEIVVDSELYCRRELVNRKVRWGPSAERLRLSMGMVFQHFTLFDHMTVLENLVLAPRKVRGVSSSVARERALALLGRVGLGAKADAYPSQLSGGQKQRAAIARELAMDRRILFFDEVTSALDPMLVSEVLTVMRELSETGMTMVVVTHEMNFARSAADRVVFMDAGRVCEDGPPAEVLTAPRTEQLQRFLGMLEH